MWARTVRLLPQKFQVNKSMNDTSLEKLKSLGLLPPSLSLGVVTRPVQEIVPGQSLDAHSGMQGKGQVAAIIQETKATSMEPVKPLSKKLESLIIVGLIALATLAHATNMLRYPYYENDEGTYISQAWSLLKSGSLSPYTYWYDHAPAGWFFLAAWAKLVGGFFTFGTSIDTGRVFMMVLHVLSALLIYGIGKRLTKGKVLPGLFAALVFSLSPLAIYFGRRVLLDNMMVFWVLLSFWLLLSPKLKLRQAVLAAVLFGVAVLTKETAIFFFPAFLYAAWIGLHRSHRLFGISLWLTISGLVVSVYPLYALLKSEFFPDTWFGSTKHVSLLETLKFQAGRGNGLPFWNVGSDFYQNLVEWAQRDMFLIIAGAAALVVALMFAYKRSEFRLPLAFAAGMLYFLLRGGLIINFYILPLVPFLALLIGLAMSLWLEQLSNFFVSVLWAKKPSFVYVGGAAACMVLAASAMLSQSGGLYTEDETTPMKEAIAWTKQTLAPESVMIVDNAIFVDLRESRFAGDPAFTHAEWFWKVEKDPDVFKKNIGGDWLNVDYVLLSHEMVRQISNYQITLTKEILPHTSLITGWSGGGAFVDLSKFISTNGDWMRVYEVHNRADFALESLWRADAKQYVHSYGQVVSESGESNASLQSEAMLRAVLAGDRDTFAGLWAWTHDHMQHRAGDVLLSEKPQASIPDYDAYLQANQTAARALLLAGKKWNNASYTASGTALAKDIWNKLAVTAGGHTVLAESTKEDEKQNRFVGAALASPVSYHMFAEVESTHPWAVLAGQSYAGLPSLSSTESVHMTVSKDGKIVATSLVPYSVSSVTYEIALDAQWYKSSEALAWLWQNRPALEAAALSSEAIEARSALLYALTITDPASANKLYQTAIGEYFSRERETWSVGATLSEKSNLWLAFSLNRRDPKLLTLLRPPVPEVLAVR